MNTTAIEQTTVKNMPLEGTPCRFSLREDLGKLPSGDIWCSDRAVPVIAFRQESTSAMISITPIIQLSAVEARAGAEHLREKVTKIVFGSTSAACAERVVAEHDHERDRDQRVDEQAVAALEVERDLGVATRVLALADVARGRLHRDHVPGQQEREGYVDREPAMTIDRVEEAGAVRAVEVNSWPKWTTEGWKIHEIARNVSGIIAKIASIVAKLVPNFSPMYEGMNSSRIPTTEIPSAHHWIGVSIGVKLALESPNRFDDVVRRQDHVQRRDREPAEPVAPRAERAEMLGPALASGP